MKGESFAELEKESYYINAKLEKVMQDVGLHDKTKWTLDVIKKMQQNRIGKHERINMIREALVEGKHVDNEEINYLKENYKKLKRVLEDKRKIQWTLDVINKLQQYEIGNSDRIHTIKRELEEGRNVDKYDIEYIKEKYGILQKISAA